jgi:hypothetical protein
MTTVERTPIHGLELLLRMLEAEHGISGEDERPSGPVDLWSAPC